MGILERLLLGKDYLTLAMYFHEAKRTFPAVSMGRDEREVEFRSTPEK
ncbi:MAG: hypothetical protein WKF87_09085 [Chryseolinea sp.]